MFVLEIYILLKPIIFFIFYVEYNWKGENIISIDLCIYM